MSPKERRTRRSPEQIIADLQKKIEEVRNRAETKKLKTSPAVKHALGALRKLDKGLAAAAEEENGALRHALADARKALAEHLEKAGMRLPKAKMPRGRRPKS